MKILIPGATLCKDEQLEMARYLVKAGYAVSITKGKGSTGKPVTYIHYNVVEVRDEQAQKRNDPGSRSIGA